jgi:hypothetical protein
MRSRRSIYDLIHPDHETITADNADSDHRPNPESEYSERQQFAPALPPELSH